MAENKLQRNVIVEFDFAVLDGAELLYEVTQKSVSKAGVEFTPILEAKCCSAVNYQLGVAALLRAVGSKQTNAADYARDIAAKFEEALNAKFATAFNNDFKNFLKALKEKDVNVVLCTRGNAEALRTALTNAGCEELATVVQEPSSFYGYMKWESWKHVITNNDLIDVLSLGITGSGYGVKQALISGIAVMAIERTRNSYQDFGGADRILTKLDAEAAAAAIQILKIKE